MTPWVDRRTPLSPDHLVADPRVAIGLWLVMIAVGSWALPRLPETVPVHFGLDGTPDGWGDRWIPLGLLPALGLLPTLIALAVRAKATSDTVRLTAGLTGNLIMSCFAPIHLIIVAKLLHPELDLVAWIFTVIGAMYIGLGRLMPHFEPNPWMGIRTPATLRDPEVWRLTHEHAGPVWMAAGLATIAAAWLLPELWSVIGMLAITIAAGVEPMLHARSLARERQDRHPAGR